LERFNSKIKKPYEIEAVIVGSGVNHHETFRASEQGIEQSLIFNEFVYHVSPNCYYKKTRSTFGRMKDKFRGIKQHYLIVFSENEHEAYPHFIVPQGKDYKPIISSHDLYNVDQSTGFKKAFAELFSSTFGNKKIIFIIAIAIIGVIAFMVYTGRVKI